MLTLQIKKMITFMELNIIFKHFCYILSYQQLYIFDIYREITKVKLDNKNNHISNVTNLN